MSSVSTQPTFVPGSQVRNVTNAGLTVYWVTFGLMAFSAVTFFIITLLKPIADRSHGYVACLIVTIASIAYYAMASQGGSAAIGITDSTTVYRSIYWARYIDWFATTPLLLLSLALISAVPIGEFMWIAACDILMILTGLFGSTSSHRFKWGFFGAGCLFQVLLFCGMVKGMFAARRRSARIGMIYTGLAAYLLMLWWGYPIVWGLAEGSNTITVNAEVASYAGLDIAAKVFFGFFIMACYPMLTRQSKEEAAAGKYVPALLTAPTNALLSQSHGYKPVGTSDGVTSHTNPMHETHSPQGSNAVTGATIGTKPVATTNGAQPAATSAGTTPAAV